MVTHRLAATGVLFLFAVVLALNGTSVEAEEGPILLIAQVDPVLGCTTSVAYVDRVEEIARETLPNEMVASESHLEALMAHATMIRQDAWYFYKHPESETVDPSTYCDENNPTTYNFRETYMQYAGPHDPVAITNNAVALTEGFGWESPPPSTHANDFRFWPWGLCHQGELNDLAFLGYRWHEMIEADAYPPGLFAPGNPCPIPAEFVEEYGSEVHILTPLYYTCLFNSGAVAGDADCDGFSDSAEAHVTTDTMGRCGPGIESGPSDAWPPDFISGSVPNSTNRITIGDLSSFVAPIRYQNTNVGTRPGDVRWDLSPGPGPLLVDINVLDESALLAGPTGYPPMLDGVRAFNGPPCPWPP